jgi:hypothetical protein
MQKIGIKVVGGLFILLAVLCWFISGSLYNILVSTLSSMIFLAAGLILLINDVTIK